MRLSLHVWMKRLFVLRSRFCFVYWLIWVFLFLNWWMKPMKVWLAIAAGWNGGWFLKAFISLCWDKWTEPGVIAVNTESVWLMRRLLNVMRCLRAISQPSQWGGAIIRLASPSSCYQSHTENCLVMSNKRKERRGRRRRSIGTGCEMSCKMTQMSDMIRYGFFSGGLCYVDVISCVYTCHRPVMVNYMHLWRRLGDSFDVPNVFLMDGSCVGPLVTDRVPFSAAIRCPLCLPLLMITVAIQLCLRRWRFQFRFPAKGKKWTVVASSERNDWILNLNRLSKK